MFLFNRILPYLSSFLILIFLEILLINPFLIYLVAIFLFFIVVLTLWQLTGRNFFNKNFEHFLISDLLFISSCFLLLLLLENTVIKQIFIIGTAIIYLLILLNIFSFLHRPEKYQPYTLENLFSYVNLITAFLFYASFFSFGLFLNTPSWLLTIFSFIIAFLISYQTLWVNKINFKRSNLFVIMIGLILAEFFWSVDFLPTSYFVNAVILIIVYYALINIVRDYLLGNLNKKLIRRYLTVSFFVLILILATAQWI